MARPIDSFLEQCKIYLPLKSSLSRISNSSWDYLDRFSFLRITTAARYEKRLDKIEANLQPKVLIQGVDRYVA
jgi:hypothetical protein